MQFRRNSLRAMPHGDAATGVMAPLHSGVRPLSLNAPACARSVPALLVRLVRLAGGSAKRAEAATRWVLAGTESGTCATAAHGGDRNGTGTNPAPGRNAAATAAGADELDALSGEQLFRQGSVVRCDDTGGPCPPRVGRDAASDTVLSASWRERRPGSRERGRARAARSRERRAATGDIAVTYNGPKPGVFDAEDEARRDAREKLPALRDSADRSLDHTVKRNPENTRCFLRGADHVAEPTRGTTPR